MPITACVFDLDGTLTNTLPTITHYANTALQACGFAPIPMDRYRALIGHGAEHLVKSMLRESGSLTDEHFAQVYAYYNRIYDADPHYLTEVYPGIPTVLKRLAQQGIQTAIFSNKPQYPVSCVARAFFPEHPFAAVCGGVPGKPKKPDPTVLLDILAHMGVSPEACVYVGDSDVDILTGQNAGVQTIGAAWGFRGEEELRAAGAHHIARQPLELLSVLSLP